MQVKAASVEHSFPRSIMRALAELTSGAKDLTLHLRAYQAASARRALPSLTPSIV